MVLFGFMLAFGAAMTHAIIDVTRKIASKRIPTVQLVCLVSIMEGTIGFAFATGQGSLGLSGSISSQPFLKFAFMSAALRLISLLLYQTAIQVSSLSATIPYLSLTPAMLMGTAYVLIGEQPSWQGLAGVGVVTIGGFLLAFSTAAVDDTKKHKEKDYSSEDGGKDNAFEIGPAQLLPSPREDMFKTGLLGSMTQAIRSLQDLGDSKGTILMVLVAALWSLTSAFDKMGLASAPSLAAYLAMQRLMTAAPCIVYLLLKDPGSVRRVYEDLWLLLAVTLSELATVILYLWSLQYLFASYAVAAKRSGILISVLFGWLFFGERIREKLAFILLMLVGMLLIVLSPDISYNKHLHNH